MTMKYNSINGCCVAGYLSDLGTAHMNYKYKNFEEFGNRLIDVGYRTNMTAWVNFNQSVEKEYLKKAGFKCVHSHGNMELYVASRVDIDKALEPIKAERLRKLLIVQEEKRKRQEREREARRNGRDVEGRRRHIYSSDIYRAIRENSHRMNDPILGYFDNLYHLQPGLPKSLRDLTWNDLRDLRDDWHGHTVGGRRRDRLVKAINYRLARM